MQLWDCRHLLQPPNIIFLIFFYFRISLFLVIALCIQQQPRALKDSRWPAGADTSCCILTRVILEFGVFSPVYQLTKRPTSTTTSVSGLQHNHEKSTLRTLLGVPVAFLHQPSPTPSHSNQAFIHGSVASDTGESKELSLTWSNKVIAQESITLSLEILLLIVSGAP